MLNQDVKYMSFQHLRIDDRDEGEVAELSDYCSTAKESETCHTELGYEADSEFTSDDMLKGELLSQVHGCKPVVCECLMQNPLFRYCRFVTNRRLSWAGA